MHESTKRTKSKGPSRRQHHHRPSTSRTTTHHPRTAPLNVNPQQQPTDLMSRLIHALTLGTYECMICYESIKNKDKVWSCVCCWAVFHLKCIQKWCQSRASQESLSNWRCPGCQTESYQEPTEYVCFCGKITEPPFHRFFTPHSCGQTCQKPRSECPHKCNELCHPGPCPPCKSYAPITSCYCGKQRLSHKCTDKQEYSKSCKQECGLMLNCGLHLCHQQCHSPPCHPCSETVQQTCFCGQQTETVPCGTQHPFSCQAPCAFVFPCTIHTCELPCHDSPHPDYCPLDPHTIDTCPCGATSVTSLLGHPRLRCTDPIPCCTSMCHKSLPCGHACHEQCHEGPCPPCTKTRQISCQGGHQTYSKPCVSVVQQVYCDTVCQQRLECRRHVCDSYCCNKTRHECHQVCGKLLKCQLHTCLQECGHRGPCHECVEGVLFDEITCHCGRTRMYPPIPCNTPPPICHYPCRRSLECEHPATAHPCHPDQVTCPPCMYFVERSCVCGKTRMKNIPCSRKGLPTCSLPCNKPIASCLHPCKRFCHTGECVDEEHACQEKCHYKRSCGHVCEFKCHGTSYCPEHLPCRAPVFSTCPCKRRRVKNLCNATRDHPTSRIVEVACDDVCALEERNKRLAEAFGMDPRVLPNRKDKLLSTLSSSLVSFAHSQPRLCQQWETVLSKFISDTHQKVYHFPQNKPNMNQLIVQLAQDYYGLQADIVDQERGKGSVICRKKGVTTRLSEDPLYLLAKDYVPPVVSAAPSTKLIANTIQNKVYPAIHIQQISCPMDAQDMKVLVEPLFHPYCDVIIKWVKQEETEGCFIILVDSIIKEQELQDLITKNVEELKQKLCVLNSWADSIDSCFVDGQGAIIEGFVQVPEIPKLKQMNVAIDSDPVIPIENAFDVLDISP